MGFSKVLLIAMSSACKAFLLGPALAARGAGQSTLQGLSGDSCRCLVPRCCALLPSALAAIGGRVCFGYLGWSNGNCIDLVFSSDPYQMDYF